MKRRAPRTYTLTVRLNAPERAELARRALPDELLSETVRRLLTNPAPRPSPRKAR